MMISSREQFVGGMFDKPSRVVPSRRAGRRRHETPRANNPAMTEIFDERVYHSALSLAQGALMDASNFLAQIESNVQRTVPNQARSLSFCPGTKATGR